MTPPTTGDLFDLAKNDMIETPLEWDTGSEPFRVPAFAPMGVADIDAADMSRHFLILGETGSGKTKSAIQPLLLAAADYCKQSEMAPAALVIDPKSELHQFIRKMSGLPEERVIHFDVKKPGRKIDLFEGSREGVPIEERIQRMLGLSRYNTSEKQAKLDAFWITQVRFLFSSLIRIDHAVHSTEGARGLVKFWRGVSANCQIATADRSSKKKDLEKAWEQIEATMASLETQTGLNDTDETLRLQVLELWWGTQLATSDVARANEFNKLNEFLFNKFKLGIGNPLRLLFRKFQMAATAFVDLTISPRARSSAGRIQYRSENYLVHHRKLLSLASQYMDDYKENIILGAFLKSIDEAGIRTSSSDFIRNMANLARNTFTSVIAVYMNLVQELTEPDLLAALSLNPFDGPLKPLGMREIRESGKWIVYSPSGHSPSTEIVGRALKTKFFEATFHRIRSAATRPTVYIADEFQRFITADPESGEQNYLDRCRAFRGICILATQSLPALRYAVGADSSSDPSGAALGTLLNNIGNKLVFRTSDPETCATLQSMLPAPSIQGRPHIAYVRPPSTLKPGECYYLFSSGQWGRGQIQLGQSEQMFPWKEPKLLRPLEPASEKHPEIPHGTTPVPSGGQFV